MARYKCPCCGMPYDGKRCRECFYESFTEEITHGNHVHEGEPLVIREAPARDPSQNARRPGGRKGCRSYPGRKKKKQSGLTWLESILLAVCLAFLQSPALDWVVDVPDFQQLPDIPSFSELEAFSELETGGDGTASAGYSVLYDENDVRILTDWQNGRAYSEPVKIYVENLSDRDLAVYTDPLYINGFLMESSSCYCEAEAGETASGELWIDSDDLEKNGIETIEELLFRLAVIDLETYDDLGGDDFVRFSCAVPDGFVQAVDDSGQVLYEQDGFRVIFRGIQGDACESAYLTFFVENESGQKADFFISESYVNDQAAEVYQWGEFLPGTRGVVSSGLYNLPKIGIDAVEEIESFELVMEIYFGDGANSWVETDRIAIELNG